EPEDQVGALARTAPHGQHATDDGRVVGDVRHTTRGQVQPTLEAGRVVQDAEAATTGRVEVRLVPDRFTVVGAGDAVRVQPRVAEVARDGEPLRGQDVRVLVTLGQHEIDRGAGRDGVRPFDVEGDLAGPADLVGTGRVERGDAVRRDDVELRCRQTEQRVEGLQ